MDFSALVEKYSPFIQKNLLPIILGILGLIFLGYGLISLTTGTSSEDIIFESSESQENKSDSEIVVDVEGSVVKPGVYRLASSARIHDALIVAGGLSAEADREWVAKNLNLAMKLTDGAKIYIPRSGESITSITGSIGTTGQVNINTASEQELDSLSGVGPVTAQKIINNRPYAAIEDLLAKKIVGSKVFGQIKDKITVY